MDVWLDGWVDIFMNMGVVEYGWGICVWIGGKGDCNILKICYLLILYVVY